MNQIQQLRDRIVAKKWRIIAEAEGDEKSPVIWTLQRDKKKGPFHLEFRADKSSQIELAFGVRIRELKETKIYLYRQHNEEAWQGVLDELANALDGLEK